MFVVTVKVHKVHGFQFIRLSVYRGFCISCFCHCLPILYASDVHDSWLLREKKLYENIILSNEYSVGWHLFPKRESNREYRKLAVFSSFQMHIFAVGEKLKQALQFPGFLPPDANINMFYTIHMNNIKFVNGRLVVGNFERLSCGCHPISKYIYYAIAK